MQILLQNRRAFYAALLPRIPDPEFRMMLGEIADFGANLLPESSAGPSNGLLRLDLVDLACKPEAGLKMGKTVISVVEALDCAIRIEEYVMLASRANGSGSTDKIFENIELDAQERFNRLVVLADSLRYHRLRLIAASPQE